MMNRRRFFLSTVPPLGLLSFWHLAWAAAEEPGRQQYGAARLSRTVVDRLADRSLPELRDFQQRELDQDYLGYWKEHGIDWENGGVMPYRELMKGMPYLAKHYYLKQMYFQGRALWTFSYLYNHFGRNERHLAIARHTKDFIYKYARNDDYSWASELTPEGKVLQKYSDIDGDFYVAMGLAEFYLATGDQEALATALETVYSANQKILAPDFMFYGAWDSRVYEPGTKFLGIWLHFLNTLIPLAEVTQDERVEKIADMCVRNIIEHHWRPEFGGFVELLDKNFIPLRESHRDSNWHGVQSAWMCMRQAVRIGDRDLFMDAMGMGRKQLRRAFSEFENIDIHAPLEELPRWGPLEDYMLFCLLTIEHTHAPWAIYWFDKVFRFAYQRPDRFEQYDLLHQPRRLFFTIELLDRMIARQGRVSDFLEV
ncbi:MAG: AGE family epimerase/isomerase [Candidatus Glassbacteria bacterium]